MEEEECKEDDEEETQVNYGKTCGHKEGEAGDSKVLGGVEENVEEAKGAEEESDEVVAIYSRGRHDSSKGLERYYLSMEAESRREEEMDSEILERCVTSDGEKAAILIERGEVKQESSDTEQANGKGSGQSEEVVEVFGGKEEQEGEEEEVVQKNDSVGHHVSEHIVEDSEHETEGVERTHNSETPKVAEDSMGSCSQDEDNLRKSTEKQGAELGEQVNDVEDALETDAKADLACVTGEEEDSDILERCVMSEINISRGGKSGEESDILERCVSENISEKGESEEVVERFLKGKDEKVLESNDGADPENEEEEEQEEEDDILEMSVKFDEEDSEEDSEKEEVIEKLVERQEMSSGGKELGEKKEVDKMYAFVESQEETEGVEQQEESEVEEVQQGHVKEDDDEYDDYDDEEKGSVEGDDIQSQEDELVKDVQQDIEPAEQYVETEPKESDSDEEVLEICVENEQVKDGGYSEKGGTQEIENKTTEYLLKERERPLSTRLLGKARASPQSPVLASSDEDSGKDQASVSKEEAVEVLPKREERARSVVGGGQKEIPFMSLPRMERMGKLLTVQRTILPSEVGALC